MSETLSPIAKAESTPLSTEDRIKRALVILVAARDAIGMHDAVQLVARVTAADESDVSAVAVRGDEKFRVDWISGHLHNPDTAIEDALVKANTLDVNPDLAPFVGDYYAADE